MESQVSFKGDNALMSKLLSIVIPNKNNSEEHLLRVVNSIPNEDDVEIILVNDKDSILPNSINGLAIKVIQNDSKYLYGLGYCRNLGVDCSDGKYIWQVDGDDYIIGLDKVMTKLRTFDGKDCLTLGYRILRDGYHCDSLNKIVEFNDIYRCNVGVWSKIIKKEIWHPNPVNMESAESSSWWYGQLGKIGTAESLDEIIYVYDRTNENAITNTPMFFKKNPMPLMELIDNNVDLKLTSQNYPSDSLRGLANLIEIYRKSSNPMLKQVIRDRIDVVYNGFVNGKYCH